MNIILIGAKVELNLSQLKDLISCARGETPSDLLIQNGTLVNVLTGELYGADIAIYGNHITNVAEPHSLEPSNTRRVLDVSGKIVSPGFIESHLHIESSMLPPIEFSKLIIPHGTTTVLLDPHEIGNALGTKGLQLLLQQTEDLPIRFLVEIPSCVPAAPGLETTAYNISSTIIQELIETEPRFFGLGEVMNYPGVLFKDEEVLKKVILGSKLNIIDGHSPNVSGRDLDAYISAGMRSDHESTTTKEFLEKLRKGMRVMVREGSLARDLRNLMKAVKETEIDLRNCLLCSDDRNIIDFCKNGHMDAHLRLVVEEGISPTKAIQMVTINPATYFGLENRIGSISPGKIADIVILEDLKDFQVKTTIFGGKIVFHKNNITWNFSPHIFPEWAIDTIKLQQAINPETFRAKISLPNDIYPIRTIGVKPHSVITESLEFDLLVNDGWIYPKPEEDVLSLSVLERYGVNGNIANAFVKGFGIKIKPFAMASTIAHDSHNLIVSGTDHGIMVKAVELLLQVNGGYVIIAGDHIQKIPLPYGGLMSIEPYQVLHDQLTAMNKVFTEITDFEEPLMALSFLALPVIPHLKLTDKGLIDVDKFKLTSLSVTE
ncbi:MAG: adenine deaminase [Candidatus Hodarchaeota archaeon]